MIDAPRWARPSRRRIYGLVEDPTASRSPARILWGISYASLNLATLAYAVSDRANAGKRVGASRAAIGLVQAMSLVGGAWIVLEVGAALGVPDLRRPDADRRSPPRSSCRACRPRPVTKKRLRLPIPHRLEIWGFVAGLLRRRRVPADARLPDEGLDHLRGRR